MRIPKKTSKRHPLHDTPIYSELPKGALDEIRQSPEGDNQVVGFAGKEIESLENAGPSYPKLPLSVVISGIFLFWPPRGDQPVRYDAR